MTDSFNDAIRRAAKLPTEAQIKARQEEEARQRQALADDMPRRNAAIQLFKTTVSPKIQSTFTQIKTILHDARFVVSEVATAGALPNVLYRLVFTVNLKSPIMVPGQMPPMLEFVLTIDETVAINVTANRSVNFAARKFPLSSIDVDTVIPKAFEDYIAAVAPLF
jgi:hypothetical protein